MTPQERAEKIIEWLDADEMAKTLDPSRAFIAAHIAEAEREAVLEAFDNKFNNEHKRCLEIEYGKGFAAAREKAKGIAAEFRIPDGFHSVLVAHDKALISVIADRIGEMEPEK